VLRFNTPQAFHLRPPAPQQPGPGALPLGAFVQLVRRQLGSKLGQLPRAGLLARPLPALAELRARSRLSDEMHGVLTLRTSTITPPVSTSSSGRTKGARTEDRATVVRVISGGALI